MAYRSTRDLPKPAQNVLPAEAQDVFLEALNDALAEVPDNMGRAFAMAWSAVRRAGWQKDGNTGKWRRVSKQGRFIAKSEKQRYTLGVVYEPDVVDTQGDFAEAEEIEKACWNFMRKLQGKDTLTKTALMVLDEIVKAAESGEGVRLDITDVWEHITKRGLNDMHVNTPMDENLGTIVECYVAPCDFQIGGETVRKGTWLLGVQWSPEYFAKIEAGERTGFSMEGRAVRIEVREDA